MKANSAPPLVTGAPWVVVRCAGTAALPQLPDPPLAEQYLKVRFVETFCADARLCDLPTWEYLKTCRINVVEWKRFDRL